VTIAASTVGSSLDYCNGVLYGASQSNIHRLQRVQNVLARVVVQAPSTISSMDIRHELHWLLVYYHISYKLSLLTWKALHTAEPSYLSELISPYAQTRSSAPYVPSTPTSWYYQPVLLVILPHVPFLFLLNQSGILYLHTSVLSIISLHLRAILNHTLSSQLLLPNHRASASDSFLTTLALYKCSCMYVCCLYLTLLYLWGDCNHTWLQSAQRTYRFGPMRIPVYRGLHI